MSIEFVEPEVPAEPTPVAGPRPSALPGRLLGAASLVAAVTAGVALQLSLYVVDRTAFVVDFDGTSTQNARIPYDAFGYALAAPVTATNAAPSSTLSVSLTDGVNYGRWWNGLAFAFLLVAVWAVVRPRSPGPAAVLSGLGGLLLGSVGTAWLAIRTVTRDSVPQIRFTAQPAIGLWLLVAAGAVATFAGLFATTRPPLRRLLPRRRV